MVVGIVYTPVSPYETMFITFSIFIAAGVFGYTITTINNVINDIRSQNEEFHLDMAIINSYMAKKNISREV